MNLFALTLNTNYDGSCEGIGGRRNYEEMQVFLLLSWCYSLLYRMLWKNY